jgi:hypothetical protein
MLGEKCGLHVIVEENFICSLVVGQIQEVRLLRSTYKRPSKTISRHFSNVKQSISN